MSTFSPDNAWNRLRRFLGRGVIVSLMLMLSACVRPVTKPQAPPMAALGPEVRVGLMVDTTAVELTSANAWELVEPEEGRVVATITPAKRVVVTSDAQGNLLFQRGSGTSEPTGSRLISARAGSDGIISIGGKPYRGTAIVRATGTGRVTAINRITLENYLLGVVPHEIGKVGEDLLEAAKAQAVAARTYAVNYMGRREELGFDVFATVQDQVYGGMEAEHEPVSRAVRETAGEILTYEGEPIDAYYHSTCAGITATIQKVWPAESFRPYLVSVSDINPATGEAFCRSSNRYQWTERWPASQFTEILNRTLADSLPNDVRSVGTLHDLRPSSRTPSGRIERLAVVTSVDTFTVGGDRIRWIFETPRGAILNSSKFDVYIERDAQGRPTEVVTMGGGWGHGIGMCQVGAMGRARTGQDYRTILLSYYTGARLQALY